jgi:hypothetical protein
VRVYQFRHIREATTSVASRGSAAAASASAAPLASAAKARTIVRVAAMTAGRSRSLGLTWGGLIRLVLALAALAAHATPAGAATLRFSTVQSTFLAGTANQGWWADRFVCPHRGGCETSNDNDTYFVGDCRDLCMGEDPVGWRSYHRNFFTFDLRPLRAHVVGATLELQRNNGFGDAFERFGLFDVWTRARALNRNDHVDARILRDLGTGTRYGSYLISTRGDPSDVLRLRLNAAAVHAINAHAGRWFSIGGTILSDSPKEEFLFAFSTARPAPRLVLATLATS